MLDAEGNQWCVFLDCASCSWTMFHFCDLKALLLRQWETSKVNRLFDNFKQTVWKLVGFLLHLETQISLVLSRSLEVSWKLLEYVCTQPIAVFVPRTAACLQWGQSGTCQGAFARVGSSHLMSGYEAVRMCISLASCSRLARNTVQVKRSFGEIGLIALIIGGIMCLTNKEADMTARSGPCPFSPRHFWMCRYDNDLK
jgi:hypothetical protein